jgi:hypothetical protein
MKCNSAKKFFPSSDVCQSGLPDELVNPFAFQQDNAGSKPFGHGQDGALFADVPVRGSRMNQAGQGPCLFNLYI